MTLIAKNVIDNQNFWKTVKPTLSDKLIICEKITLVENEKIITDKKEIAKVINYFLNVIKTLNIPQTNSDWNFENVRYPTLRLY